MSAAIRRRIAFLHVDVEVVVAVPRHEPVILEPLPLKSGGKAVRIGHCAELVHSEIEYLLDDRIRHLHAGAFAPERRPMRGRL